MLLGRLHVADVGATTGTHSQLIEVATLIIVQDNERYSLFGLVLKANIILL